MASLILKRDCIAVSGLFTEEYPLCMPGVGLMVRVVGLGS